MPGIHPLKVARQGLGLSPLGGDDEEPAVRAEEHVIRCLTKYDPLAVGRVFREKIAAAISRSPAQRFGLAALPPIERQTVQVEQELRPLFEELVASRDAQEEALRPA